VFQRLRLSSAPEGLAPARMAVREWQADVTGMAVREWPADVTSGNHASHGDNVVVRGMHGSNVSYDCVKVQACHPALLLARSGGGCEWRAVSWRGVLARDEHPTAARPRPAGGGFTSVGREWPLSRTSIQWYRFVNASWRMSKVSCTFKLIEDGHRPLRDKGR
jgi:hypothetical protein